MKAPARTLFVLLLGSVFAGSALAAMDSTSGDPSSAQNAAPNSQTPAHLGQKLRDDLTKAGFTNITIMPSSFLVRAKDSQGNPVMMVINPDSLTEVTQHTTEHDDAPLAGAIKGGPNSGVPTPAPKQ
jgi:hypothetical protein